jgi:hypothetical protein
MGENVNGRLANGLGQVYLVLVTLARGRRASR